MNSSLCVSCSHRTRLANRTYLLKLTSQTIGTRFQLWGLSCEQQQRFRTLSPSTLFWNLAAQSTCQAEIEVNLIAIDWCGFYHIVRNSLVALLEALCAMPVFLTSERTGLILSDRPQCVHDIRNLFTFTTLVHVLTLRTSLFFCEFLLTNMLLVYLWGLYWTLTPCDNLHRCRQLGWFVLIDTGEYGRYRRSMSIHLRRITVDHRSSINDRDNFVINTIDNTCNFVINTIDNICKRVLKDFRWFIRHHSSVVESAALKKVSNP